MDLCEARIITGKKQREIAKAAGISVPQISRLENGKRTGVTLHQRQLIEQYLGIGKIEWSDRGYIMQNETMINLTEKLMKAKEVAKLLSCSAVHVYQMARRGQLRCVRWDTLGQGQQQSNVRFRPQDVFAFIEEHSV